LTAAVTDDKLFKCDLPVPATEKRMVYLPPFLPSGIDVQLFTGFPASPIPQIGLRTHSRCRFFIKHLSEMRSPDLGCLSLGDSIQELTDSEHLEVV